MNQAASGGGFPGYLRRRAEGLWRRIWPLTLRRSLVLVLLALVIALVAFEARATEIFSVQVNVVPGENIAYFNPTTEQLDFGDLSRGAGQTRHITLSNDSVIPNRVYIMVLGDIGDFIKISDAFLTLDSGEVTQVDLTLVVPQTADVKKYSGQVLVFRHPWFPLP